VGAALSIGLLGLGCTPAKTPQTNPPAGNPTTPGPSTPDFSRPVQASTLREQAIAVIEESARSADPQVRANAVEAAGRASGRLKTIVEKGLVDPNVGVRSVAAMTVGRSKIRDLAERCRSLLDDPAPQPRVAAIFALAANGRTVDQTPLADVVLNGPTVSLRAQAAFVLGELGNPSSKPLLQQALAAGANFGTPEQLKIYQLQVAEALIKLGDDEQRTGVRAALYPNRSEELEAAALAAQILGQINDRQAISQLVYLSEYRDSAGNTHPAEVRLAVADTLSTMGVKGGAFIPEQYLARPEPAIRAQVAHVYGSMSGNQALWRLDELLKDREGIVRVAAADGILRALGK
jgi:HEAT repeat protein